MANEITYSMTVTCTNGSYSEIFRRQGTITQALQGAASGIQTIGTSEENLILTDITTNGAICLQNLDATNFVDWGLNDSGTMKAIGRIKPGESQFWRLKPGTTLR